MTRNYNSAGQLLSECDPDSALNVFSLGSSEKRRPTKKTRSASLVFFVFIP